jgi:K+-sensing histidine kinase KdpD
MDGDPELLGSMLQSLVENAIKFSPAHMDCFVRIKEEERHMVIEVQDQGPGIPVAQREAVFSRFHRDPLHSMHVQGSGLGLTIARRIAEVHGGTIRIADAVPAGALFIVEMKKTS